MISNLFHEKRTGVLLLILIMVLGLFFTGCGPLRTEHSINPTLHPPTSTQGIGPTAQYTEHGSTPTAESDPWQIDFDGQRALNYVEEQMAFGVRIPGTDGHALTVDWIIDNLQKSGWKIEEQVFAYNGLDGRNIIGVAGPEEGQLVILGAHYDTRPISDKDENHPQEPVPGANDGGSGVAVLLELARVIELDELNHPIWLVFFDLEDSGGIEGKNWIVGSSHFAENLDREPSAVIIVDMVGDVDQQIYFEVNSDVALMKDIWGVAELLGFDSFIPETKHSLLDDHTPFLRRGIRAIDIIDFDYPYWHTTQDTLDKVSATSLEQVGQTLEVWLKSKWPLEN